MIYQHICPADRGQDEICPIIFCDGKWQVKEMVEMGMFIDWRTKEVFEDNICCYCKQKLPNPPSAPKPSD